MNIINIKRKESGVGLIEILIVLVVLVIGWAAIAALQGKLMSGTSLGKARNEALELAREKTEELRNTIEKGQFDAELPSTGVMSTPAEIITGVNATFSRHWLLDDITDGTGTGFLKKLVMEVTWEGNDYDADKKNLERVLLNSMIAYTDAPKMATFANGGTGNVGEGAPFPTSATEGPTNIPITSSSEDPDEEGDSDGDASTNDNIYTGVDENGNLVVFQGGRAAGDVELTVYGGKILKFSGIIYYNSSHPYVRATSPSFCTTFLQSKTDCGFTGSPEIECAKYVCYAGGDCSKGGDVCNAELSPEQIAALPTDLKGGWYGKIGDFFPSAPTSESFPAICMGDSVDVAARLYVTKRVNSDSLTGFSREGINTSFECYDTLISTESPTGCSKLIADLAGYGIKVNPSNTPNEIADYQAERPLAATGDPNVVLAATNEDFDNGVFPNFCSMESSTGDLAGDYECTCKYIETPTPSIDWVTGIHSSGEPATGCCSKDDCLVNVPDGQKNNSTFTYSCTYTPL